MASAPWQSFAESVVEPARSLAWSPVLTNLLGKGLPAEAWGSPGTANLGPVEPLRPLGQGKQLVGHLPGQCL